MEISSIAYLIVGAFILGFSFFLSSVGENVELQKLTLFLLAGGLFILIGLFKLLFKKKPKPSKANYPHHQHPSQHVEHHKPPTHAKYCSHCGAALRHFDQFCHKCGSRTFR